MTNGNLLDFNNEINNWGKHGSILLFFNKSKIREFYNNNGIRLHTLTETINTIKQKYLIFENVDNKEVVKFTGEGKDRKPVFIEGASEEDYNKELDELLNKEVNLIF